MLQNSDRRPRPTGAKPYLTKRRNSQYWQVRLMVPPPVRPALGRREFTRSLRETDHRRAEIAALSLLADWKSQIEEALRASAPKAVPAVQAVPTELEREEAALEVGYEIAGRRLEALIKRKAQEGLAFDRLKAEFERRYLEFVRRHEAGEDAYWCRHADAHIAKRNWLLPRDSEEYRHFVKALAKCGMQTLARAIAKSGWTEDQFAPSPYVAHIATRMDARAQPGETMMELFGRYRDQRLAEGKKRKDNLDQDEKVIEQFAAFVGEQRGLPSLRRQEVRDWRDTLTKLPPAFGKRNSYKGKSLREVAAIASSKGEKGLNLVTINRYLSALSAFLDWAVRNGFCDANVCDGLFFDVDKSKRRRSPFNAYQLNAIIHSPLFCGFREDGKEWLPGDKKAADWRVWVPLICIFTGARIGEVAQLRLADVVREGDKLCLVIRDDERAGQRTKNGQTRLAPVHSMLLAFGFEKMVQSAIDRARGIVGAALFPELSRNERGQFGKASRFWRTYLTRVGIKQGADGFGAHSFRHGLTDQLRLAGYLDREIALVLGHSQKTVTAGYGQIREGTVARLSGMIEDIRFEGVDFTHLLHQVSSAD